MIVFRKLTFANLLSVGNQPVTVDFNEHKTTLVHGTNGSGKSSILDALCYVLFNKPFRRINLPQLVNSQNKKGLLVECELNIGKDTFFIRRGMKPRVFEIFKNDKIIENKANDRDHQNFLEQSILKLSFKSFTQIVILGSSNFVPFMQLSSIARRECVEDFLDIKVFSTMAMLAKERVRALKERKRSIDDESLNLEFRIETLQDKIDQLSKRDEAELENYKSQIADHNNSIYQINVKLKQWYDDIKTQQQIIDEAEEKKPSSRHQSLNTAIIKLNAKLERLVKEKEFFEQDACPTCGQDIEFALKTGAQSRIQKEMEEVDKASIQATAMLQEQAQALEYLQELNLRMREFNKKVFELQTELKSHNDSIATINKRMMALESEVVNLNSEIILVNELSNQRTNVESERDNVKADIDNHDTVLSLLKDSGIKTHIVRKYLPVMNRFIRHYLTELDFPIHFQLDSEFNEQVKSPLHQDFSYQSFSEGQKGRIDLAMMFCWRDICSVKNSVSTNLLILDEVFSSSLDEVGKECLLRLIRFSIPDTQRVVVVDHTLGSSDRDKFDHCIEVIRKGGFSSYS